MSHVEDGSDDPEGVFGEGAGEGGSSGIEVQEGDEVAGTGTTATAPERPVARGPKTPMDKGGGFVRCPVCQKTIKAQAKYGHFSRNHVGLNYAQYRDGFTSTPKAPEELGEGAQVYKQEADANRLLRTILDTHPDIPDRVVDEVLSWAEFGPIHPIQLVYLLTSMKGITAGTANIISQKYSYALQKAQAEGRVEGIPPLGPMGTMAGPGASGFAQPIAGGWNSSIPTTPQPWGQSQSWPGQTWSPNQQQQPGNFVTREELLGMNRQREEQTRMERMEERMEKMQQDFHSELKASIAEVAEKLQPATQYEIIEEPVDAQGQLTSPDSAVTLRRRRVPVASSGGPSREVEDLKGEVREMRQRDRERDERDLQELKAELRAMREKGSQPTGPSPEITEMKTELGEYKKTIEDLKGALQDRDKQVLIDKIGDLEGRLDRLATVGSGFQSDEFKMIASTFGEIKDLLKTAVQEKAARGFVKELVTPPGVVSELPPETPGLPEDKGIVEAFRQQGLVATFRKRIGGPLLPAATPAATEPPPAPPAEVPAS